MAQKPPSTWLPTQNYTPGNNGSNYVIIHDTEGSFDSGVAWLRNPQAQASAHIIVSKDGSRVAELVKPTDSSWAAANLQFNLTGINIEIEGYTTVPYAENVYKVVGEWVAYYCAVRGIPLRMAVDDLYSRNVVRRGILGHMNVPGASHTDPGHLFDFEKLLAYAKGSTPSPNPAPPSGTVYRVVVEAGQAGAFSSQANANDMVAKLKALNVKATVVPGKK